MENARTAEITNPALRCLNILNLPHLPGPVNRREAEEWDEFVGMKAALSMMSLVIDNDGRRADPGRWREVGEKLSGNPRDRLLLASAHWLMPEEVRQAAQLD